MFDEDRTRNGLFFENAGAAAAYLLDSLQSAEHAGIVDRPDQDPRSAAAMQMLPQNVKAVAELTVAVQEVILDSCSPGNTSLIAVIMPVRRAS
jgi:hypothetical protein